MRSIMRIIRKVRLRAHYAILEARIKLRSLIKQSHNLLIKLNNYHQNMKRAHTDKTLSEKIEVINYVELHSTVSRKKIANLFDVKESTLSGWIKNKDTLKSFFTITSGINARRKSTSKHEIIDAPLLERFRWARSNSHPVDGETLRLKAQELLQQLELPSEVSKGWIDRWKKHHNIHQATVSGESQSVNNLTVEEWKKNQLRIILQRYPLNCIFNLDETALFWKLLPNKTLNFKNERCSGGTKSKERITILLGASATGEKLQPLNIGRSAKHRCFRNKVLPNSILYKYNKKAWMTGEFFGQYLRLLDSKNRHPNRNVALIIDNCPANTKIDNLTNTTLYFLPPQHNFQNSAYGFRNYKELQNFLQNISRAEKNSANGRRGSVRTRFIPGNKMGAKVLECCYN